MLYNCSTTTTQLIPAAIENDSFDRRYKGHDCGPRSGPEIGAKVPRGISDPLVGAVPRGAFHLPFWRSVGPRLEAAFATAYAEKRVQVKPAAIKIVALLLALGYGLPAQADAPVDCQVDAGAPVSFVGTTDACIDKLGIAQVSFDVVAPANRSGPIHMSRMSRPAGEFDPQEGNLSASAVVSLGTSAGATVFTNAVPDRTNTTDVTASGGGSDGANGVSFSAMATAPASDGEVGLTVSKSTLAMDEGGNDSFTIKLNSEPSGEVTVTVSTDDVDAASVSSDGGATQSQSVALTFATTNWELEQAVTVTGVGDDDTNDETPTISFLVAGADYDGIAVASVSASVTDTNVKALTISKESLEVSEGSSDTFTLVLGAAPSGDVTVRVALGDGDPASLAKEGAETSSDAVELTFTTADWNTPQTVTLTATDNLTISSEEGGAATLTLSTTSSADSDYGALVDQTLNVTIIDDEAAALVTSVSTLTMDAGGTASFTLALGGTPSSEVSVTLGSSSNVLTLAATSLTFDATSWSAPQTVTLTAAEDTNAGDISAEVSLVALGAEFDQTSSKVQVRIVEKDAQAPPEDTGALVSSLATSDVMGAQLGNLISDAVSGGISAPNTANETSTQTQSAQGDVAADVNHEAYNRLQVLSAREGDDGFTLVDWFSVGLSQASLDASLSGDGTLAYAIAGREVTKTENGVGGLLYGVEISSWDYEEETDVDRTGFSLGYYHAQQRSGLTFSGSAIYTLTLNDFASASGATGDATSQRVIFKGSLSGERALDRVQGTFKPYVNLMYASESLEAFSFSDGTTSDASTTQLGRLGLGIEYSTNPTESGNRFLVRGELSQVFGTDAITLSDGEVYSPNEDPVGAVTFGWLTQPGADTSARIELTFGELGNSEREEIRLDGTIDRTF